MIISHNPYRGNGNLYARNYQEAKIPYIFVLFLPIGFGIAFQLPLVMLMLQRIGIFTTKAYLAKWRVAILVIFVIAMFLTPADPLSICLLYTSDAADE